MFVHRMIALAALACGVAFLAGPVQADPKLPTPEPTWRPLRPDYINTWYIFNDRNLNGILDPGDERVDTLENWWTPVSAHTQHNYSEGPYGANSLMFGPNDDKPSAPMNFASQTDPNDNYWLPRAKNAINFYMSYSQFDNNDWSTFDGGGTTPVGKQVARQRNLYRNGWSLGWVTHDVTVDGSGNFTNDQSPGGSVKMDVFVHNGEGTFFVAGLGTSRSNPQVAMSNDIDNLALDNSDGPGTGTQWHPPDYDDAALGYSWPKNALRMLANGLTPADLATIVASMEVQEKDPPSLGPADVIWANRSPQQIKANLDDHAGADYEYQDAFVDRSFYAEGSTDGGVVAGLSGYDNYDPLLNNWGDQQVIRIDIAPETLQSDEGFFGNITTVVFWDFGAIGSDQLHPRAIVLDLADTSLFPENRFYLARSSQVPEPTVMAVLVLGGVALLFRRRCRRPAA